MKRAVAFLFAVLLAGQVFADCRPFYGPYGGSTLTGYGYAKYLPSTAKRLTDTPDDGVVIHAMAIGAIMSVQGAAIRYRTDGVSPTATSGTYLPAGTIVKWSGPEDAAKLRQLRFIQVSAGAEVTFDYCW